MSLTSIFSYPEFLIVALLAVVALRNQDEWQRWHAPDPVREFGLLVFQQMPARYRQWNCNLHTWSGWRSYDDQADVAALKAVLAVSALLVALVVPPAAALVATAGVYFLPDLVLLWRARMRQQEIRDALPQALDLMVMCVDAGLGLDAALQRVASDTALTSRALNEELQNLSRDILLGMDRPTAYFELYKRTGVEELKMLGSALNQSTKLGLSIARILRAQSDFLRTRQSQKAEERAAKLPVWMAFPLWFCIMPALMFVIIGPAIITFLQNIGNVLPGWMN